jgi:HK97 family phage prohead protease
MPVSSNRQFGPKTMPSAPTPEKPPARTFSSQIAAKDPVLPANRESRCLMAGVELRVAKNGKGPGTIVGYAAVFGMPSQDLGGFIERIAPGAFAGVLTNDVRALKNHDANYILGRNKAGSLRMVEDVLGLRVEIDLPDTQVGRDTATEISAGLMDGMSFSFTTDVDEWDYSGKVPIRTLVKVRELYDVGPVAYPAYTDTSAAMRSLERSNPSPKPAQVLPPVDRSADLHFEPLDSFHFRMQVEQLSVLRIPRSDP